MPAMLQRRRATGTPASDTDSVHDPSTTFPAQQLRQAFAAVRLSFTWLGVRKSLSPEQKAQAAEGFGAEGNYLSAAKKLLDTHHPAYQRVTSVRSQIQSYFKSLSLPYPEPAVRLIRQSDVASFDRRLAELRTDLAEAVKALDEQLAALKADAKERLGRLYHNGDYPETLQGLFGIEWDYPSLEDPPSYLLRLNPQLYEQERQRIAARFDEAVQLAEQAFTAELSTLVNHLFDRLTPGPDGTKKVFRDTAVTNLSDFFDRFKHLSIGSNAELEKLVETAQQALAGAEPQAVRDSDSLRQQVSRQLAVVQSSLDGLLVDQPRRRVLRPTTPTTPVQEGGS